MALGWGEREEDGGTYLLFPKSRVEMRGGSRGRGGIKLFPSAQQRHFPQGEKTSAPAKADLLVFFFYEVTFANEPACKVQNPPRYYA